MKTRQEAAESYADKLYTDRKNNIHWTSRRNDFLAGCEYANNEQRDFYLLVNEYFYGTDKSKSAEVYGKISHRLKAFTEQYKPEDNE
jgi:hypothetical protein